MKKGLTPLRKQKLSKKAQEKYDKIKRNLKTENQNWNDWKFQIHWNILDWVNPRSKFVRKEPYSNSSKKYYIEQDDGMTHWIDNSKLKVILQ